MLALLFWVLLPTQYTGPEGGVLPFTAAGRATLAVMAWMAAWWLMESIHIYATALLPLVLFPLLGVRTMAQAVSAYASPLISCSWEDFCWPFPCSAGGWTAGSPC